MTMEMGKSAKWIEAGSVSLQARPRLPDLGSSPHQSKVWGQPLALSCQHTNNAITGLVAQIT